MFVLVFLVVLVLQGRRGDYGVKGAQGPDGTRGEKVSMNLTDKLRTVLLCCLKFGYWG